MNISTSGQFGSETSCSFGPPILVLKTAHLANPPRLPDLFDPLLGNL